MLLVTNEADEVFSIYLKCPLHYELKNAIVSRVPFLGTKSSMYLFQSSSELHLSFRSSLLAKLIAIFLFFSGLTRSLVMCHLARTSLYLATNSIWSVSRLTVERVLHFRTAFLYFLFNIR